MRAEVDGRTGCVRVFDSASKLQIITSLLFQGVWRFCASVTLLGFLFYFRSLHVWASVALWNEGGHFSPSSQMTSAQPSPARLSPHFASRPVLLFPARRVTFLWSRLWTLNHSNHIFFSSPRTPWHFPIFYLSFVLSTCTTQVRTGSFLAALLCTLV